MKAKTPAYVFLLALSFLMGAGIMEAGIHLGRITAPVPLVTEEELLQILDACPVVPRPKHPPKTPVKEHMA